GGPLARAARRPCCRPVRRRRPRRRTSRHAVYRICRRARSLVRLLVLLGAPRPQIDLLAALLGLLDLVESDDVVTLAHEIAHRHALLIRALLDGEELDVAPELGVDLIDRTPRPSRRTLLYHVALVGGIDVGGPVERHLTGGDARRERRDQVEE